MAKAAKKTAKKKAVSKKAGARKAVSKKTATKKKPAAKKAAKKTAKKAAAKKTAVKKPATKKTAKKKTGSKKKVTSKKKKAATKVVKKTAKKTTKKVAAKVSNKTASKATKKTAKKAPAKKPAKKTATKKATTTSSAAKPKAAPKKASGGRKKVAQATAQAVAVPSKETRSEPTAVLKTRSINLDEIKIAADYKPTPGEEYMSPQQLVYFRNKLRSWRDELIIESQETLDHLRSEIRDVGDEAERASRESDNILELRTRDRYRKLLKKIDDAIKRVEDGSYGYCEETGEEIGLGRLEARPIATLTVDAQERREMFQRQFRDDH